MKNIIYLHMVIFALYVSCSENKDSGSLCGNGKLDNGEDCEKSSTLILPHIFSRHCEDYGYYKNADINCKDCRLDFTPCLGMGQCGDGVLNENEECDGDVFRHEDCIAAGHYSGFLSCNDDCTYDLSNCARCGDGIIQAEQGEVCDSDVVTEDCPAELNFGQDPACSADCKSHDFTPCGTAIYSFGRHEKILSLGLSASGNIIISGQTGGEFDGNSNVDPECVEFDIKQRIYDSCESSRCYYCLDAFAAEINSRGDIIKSNQWGSNKDETSSIIQGQLSSSPAFFYISGNLNVRAPDDFSYECHLETSFELTTGTTQLVTFNDDFSVSSSFMPEGFLNNNTLKRLDEDRLLSIYASSYIKPFLQVTSISSETLQNQFLWNEGELLTDYGLIGNNYLIVEKKGTRNFRIYELVNITNGLKQEIHSENAGDAFGNYNNYANISENDRKTVRIIGTDLSDGLLVIKDLDEYGTITSQVKYPEFPHFYLEPPAVAQFYKFISLKSNGSAIVYSLYSTPGTVIIHFRPDGTVGNYYFDNIEVTSILYHNGHLFIGGFWGNGFDFMYGKIIRLNL